jgi:hypothetical protein
MYAMYVSTYNGREWFERDDRSGVEGRSVATTIRPFGSRSNCALDGSLACTQGPLTTTLQLATVPRTETGPPYLRSNTISTHKLWRSRGKFVRGMRLSNAFTLHEYRWSYEHTSQLIIVTCRSPYWKMEYLNTWWFNSGNGSGAFGKAHICVHW